VFFCRVTRPARSAGGYFRDGHAAPVHSLLRRELAYPREFTLNATEQTWDISLIVPRKSDAASVPPVFRRWRRCKF
jgi:hypothetical protein